MTFDLLFYSIIFVILFFISAVVNHYYKKPKSTSVSASSGSIVMAIGIFALYALQNLPFNTSFLTKLITLELLIIWFYIVVSFFHKKLL